MKRLWLAALCLPTLAWADEPAAGPPDEIVVTAIKGMWSLDGKRIRAAQAVFLANRDRYAPGSRMFFQIYPKMGASTNGLQLTLRRGDEIEAVPFDGELRFGIKPLDADDWRLTANRTPAQIGVKLWILSPGTGEADRRLGDLRLYCRVGWAFIKDRVDFIERAGFDAIGGCDTKRVGLYTGGVRPIASATVTPPGGAARPLGIVRESHYRMPLADRDLPDDSRIHVLYR